MRKVSKIQADYMREPDSTKGPHSTQDVPQQPPETAEHPGGAGGLTAWPRNLDSYLPNLGV